MDTTTTERTLEEAARWSARLCAPDCTDRERADFERWLRQDLSHADAFAAAQLVSDGVGLLSEVDPRLQALADEAFAMGDSDVPLAARPRASRRRWAIPIGLAAGIAVAMIGLKLGPQLASSPSSQVYTAWAEPRSLTLGDGSKVQLDVSSEIRVSLTAGQRRVELLDGRALFEVAHDSSRPFSVSAAGSRTTALGTRFQVQRHDDAVTVILAEGSVAVDSLRSGDTRREKLVPGDELKIGADGDAVWVKQHVDPEIATSWSQGRLVFRGTPLADAIEEVNRYSPHNKLVLGDPSLSGLLVSGNFIPGDSRMIVSAFAAVLPLRTVENGREILLFRRHEGSGG